MDYIYYIFKNENIIYLLLFFTLGWLARRLYKLFIFLRLIFIGRLGEKKARTLLIRNGYEILKEQIIIKGKLLYNERKKSYFIKPDFLVKKNNKVYIAEVKTGKSASIKNINTRRQLLEYATNLNSKEILLVNIDKKSINQIEFL